ncbi:MAG: hypothetical protein U5L96_00970 [Owenweeksia sp.]|nr:hypothetical protein [Owenweeksia sp.]
MLGLYADTLNRVAIKIIDNQDNYAHDTIEIQTGALNSDLPKVEIIKVQASEMEPGMHLAGLHLANNGKFNTQPIAFDNDGHIRYHCRACRL